MGAQLLAMGGEFFSVMKTWEAANAGAPPPLSQPALACQFLPETVAPLPPAPTVPTAADFDRVLGETYGPFRSPTPAAEAAATLAASRLQVALPGRF